MAGHSSQPLGAENSSHLTANKKTGTSVLYHNELDSDNTLKELGGGLSLRRDGRLADPDFSCGGP